MSGGVYRCIGHTGIRWDVWGCTNILQGVQMCGGHTYVERVYRCIEECTDIKQDVWDVQIYRRHIDVLG